MKSLDNFVQEKEKFRRKLDEAFIKNRGNVALTAAEIGISLKNFGARVKELFGLPPSQYYNKYLRKKGETKPYHNPTNLSKRSYTEQTHKVSGRWLKYG